MKLSDIVDNIQSKLEADDSAKIADDLANILIVEEANDKTIKEKDATISKISKDKEMLIQANGNLLLQVPQGKEENLDEGKIEERKDPFDYRSIFENGKFKR